RHGNSATRESISAGVNSASRPFGTQAQSKGPIAKTDRSTSRLLLRPAGRGRLLVYAKPIIARIANQAFNVFANLSMRLRIVRLIKSSAPSRQDTKFS